MDVTNIDKGELLLGPASFDDDLLTFDESGTVEKGTILARDSDSGNLVPYVDGGTTNENGIPKVVLAHDVTADGAGDEPCRVITKGELRLDKMIIAADGDSSNIDKVVRDQLRDYGIVSQVVRDGSVLDN